MHGAELRLHVCAYAELECRAYKNTYFTGIELPVKLRLLCIGVVAVYKCNLLFRNALFCQMPLQFRIYAEIITLRR